MFKIAAVLYGIVAPVMMGVFFTVTLFVEQLYNGPAMIVAALLGAVAAAPVSWLVARSIVGRPRGAGTRSA
ncbi:hypothetical protein [Rubrimonas cliftonensis]|uniref:CTP synthetase n=1 Tax=Rubrimonas cliftonensis TaxID=89524 RepID=A0A1H3W273_9RHOB|nr:hypothetical protein [Rubrimonas cliftonensis]SDZ81139.1 hypothetical protein SAMN05444370_101472 [Rubrimonas cliftonensis]